jgi:hypothetical protein
MILAALLTLSHPLDRLHDAIAAVESNHNAAAVGDGGRALGPLQIHVSVVADVNRAYLTAFAHRDMHDPRLAKAVFRHYLALWATPERLGRPQRQVVPASGTEGRTAGGANRRRRIGAGCKRHTPTVEIKVLTYVLRQSNPRV